MEETGRKRKGAAKKVKEKTENIRAWVREHKKRAAGILIVFLLVIGAGVIGIAGINSANRAEAENKKIEEIKTAKEETKKETKKKEDKKQTDQKKEKQEEKKEETDSKEKDAAEKPAAQEAGKTAQPSGTVTAPASGNIGENKAATGESKHTHNYSTPIYGTEQKWVVDQAAWTETVNEPIYETVPVMKCNDCGAYLNANNCWDHIENHALNGGKGSWTDTYESQQTGTNTYTIDHPEQGHWESYSIVTGYQCSCGAVQ